jgi:hypothetical protein
MNKRWIFIIGLLLIVTGLLAWQLSRSIRQFNRENDPSRITSVRPVPVNGRQNTMHAVQPPPQSASDFKSIVDQNVFSDTRSNNVNYDAPVVIESPPIKNRPYLLGVMVSAGESFATLLDPSNPQSAVPGKRRGRTMRVGDVYEGYTLVDIAKDQIVLQNGTRSEVIKLGDSARKKEKGIKTPLIASRIIGFGSSAINGVTTAAPVEMAGNRPPVQVPNTPTPRVEAPVPAPVTAPKQNVQAAVGQQGITVATPVPMTISPAGIDTQTNRIVIRSPLGDIITYPP